MDNISWDTYTLQKHTQYNASPKIEKYSESNTQNKSLCWTVWAHPSSSSQYKLIQTATDCKRRFFLLLL